MHRKGGNKSRGGDKERPKPKRELVDDDDVDADRVPNPEELGAVPPSFVNQDKTGLRWK